MGSDQAVVTIDGPSGAGKSTISKLLAARLHYTYLDTGAMYRLVGLKVQRSGDRLNTFCYDRITEASLTPEFAEGVRDNGPDVAVGTDLAMNATIADLTYSSLLLDDVSPLYRADLFARMWTPLTGGNVTRQELEVANRALFGGIFESAYLGRNTECLQCHIFVDATTLTTSPETNRHWSVLPDVNVEMAVYGQFDWGNETRVLEEVHAIFRHAGVVDYSWCEGMGCNPGAIGTTEGQTVWGLSTGCGLFRSDNHSDPAVDIDDEPYMAGSYSQGSDATIFELEERLRSGFDTLAEEGLVPGGNGTYMDFADPESPEAAMAYLFSLNFAEGIWKEAMGYPLTVANKFPRNQGQMETLKTLAETFYTSHYSLRNVIVEVAAGEYFNQAPPDTCGSASLYAMPALFDPFTKEAVDPLERGNGVGDMVHRASAAVLMDSVSQAMWWSRFERFGVQTTGAFVAAFLDPPLDVPGGDIPFAITHIDPASGQGLGCCGAGFCDACVDAPNNVTFLRDIGLHINQFDAGFSGTDFNGLLHWEEEYASGQDPDLGGPTQCTGPLGAEECASSDYIDRLVSAASGATMRDVAVALKDRLITEPAIAGDAEVAAIEAIMGETLDTDVSAADDAEGSARRYAGVLLNTPQFLLEGVVSRDQPVADYPAVVVSGTSAEDSCQYFVSLAAMSPEWSGILAVCTGGGISVN